MRQREAQTLPPGEWDANTLALMEIPGVGKKFLLAKLANHGRLKFTLIWKTVTEAMNSDRYINTALIINISTKTTIIVTAASGQHPL